MTTSSSSLASAPAVGRRRAACALIVTTTPRRRPPRARRAGAGGSGPSAAPRSPAGARSACGRRAARARRLTASGSRSGLTDDREHARCWGPAPDRRRRRRSCRSGRATSRRPRSGRRCLPPCRRTVSPTRNGRALSSTMPGDQVAERLLRREAEDDRRERRADRDRSERDVGDAQRDARAPRARRAAGSGSRPCRRWPRPCAGTAIGASAAAEVARERPAEDHQREHDEDLQRRRARVPARRACTGAQRRQAEQRRRGSPRPGSRRRTAARTRAAAAARAAPRAARARASGRLRASGRRAARASSVSVAARRWSVTKP